MNPPPDDAKVTVHRRQRLVDDFFKLDATEFSYPRYDGSMSAPVRRLTLDRGDSVAALLHSADGDTAWLVEQFRIAAWQPGPGWIVEAVAGMVAPGESAEAALRREVQEETGFEIAALQLIGCFYLSPGGSSERVHLYQAQVAARSGAGGGLAAEGEDIRLVAYSRSALAQALQAGHLQDAKTVIAVQHFLASAA